MNPVKVHTPIPGPKSQEMVTRAMQSIARAQYAGLFGITVTAGKDAYITDADGNTFLDFLAGASAVSVGYSRQDVIDVYAKTAQKIQHTCFPYSPNEEATLLAERLIKLTPGNFEKRVFFGMMGSDAVDAAIKIARRYTGKPGIISFKGGYHGATGFSMSANGFAGLQKGLFISSDFIMTEFPRTDQDAEKALSVVEALLKEGNIAALITECIQGDGGNVVPPPYFHQQLAELLHQYNAVHVIDEVQSGVGRSGKWWECQTYDLTPDILCCGKAITSGYVPMGACIARAEMAQTLDKAQHLFTYSGHPPTAAVAMKVFDIVEQENLIQNAIQRGEQLRTGLQKLVDRYAFAKEVRGRGLHMGFEVYDDRTDTPLGGLFAFRCAEKGLYPGYFGSKNEVMRLHPPLIVNQEQMQFAVDQISAVCDEWNNGTFPEQTIQSYRKFGVGLGTD